MAIFAGGIIALVLGILGIIFWWGNFIGLLLGAVPIMLLMCGALAVYLGLEEIKDKRAANTTAETTDSLKEEVASLKEEIQELKTDKEPESK